MNSRASLRSLATALAILLSSVAFAGTPESVELSRQYVAIRPGLFSDAGSLNAGASPMADDLLALLATEALRHLKETPDWTQDNPEWKRMQRVIMQDLLAIRDEMKSDPRWESINSKFTEIFVSGLAEHLSQDQLIELVHYYSTTPGKQFAEIQPKMIAEVYLGVTQMHKLNATRQKPQLPTPDKEEFSRLFSLFEESLKIQWASLDPGPKGDRSGLQALPMIMQIGTHINFARIEALWQSIPEQDRVAILAWRNSDLGKAERAAIFESAKGVQSIFNPQDEAKRFMDRFSSLEKKWRAGVVFDANRPTVATTQTLAAPPADYVPIEKAQIASRFMTISITRENLAAEASKCIPQLNGDSETIKKAANNVPIQNVVGFSHLSSANLFLTRYTTAICLQKSSARFPIFAAEAFLETVNPKGVPPDVVDGWYKQIALLIATKGIAKVAYVYGNGNAFAVSYWVEPTSAFGLYYSSTFNKAGTWETGTFDARFSHPAMTSVSETQRSGVSQKTYPLAHRTL